MSDNIKQSEKDNALLQIIYLFVLPIILIYFKIIPDIYKVPMLVAVVFVCIVIMHREKWNNIKCGFIRNYSSRSIFLYSIFTCFGLWSIFHFAFLFGFRPSNNWWMDKKFLLLFIPLSVLQEILYRMFLIPKLKIIFDHRLTVVLVNGALFTLLHIIYPEPRLMLPLAFAGGLGFATLYMYKPNIVLSSMTHIILNFFAVLLGFFTIVS